MLPWVANDGKPWKTHLGYGSKTKVCWGQWPTTFKKQLVWCPGLVPGLNWSGSAVYSNLEIAGAKTPRHCHQHKALARTWDQDRTGKVCSLERRFTEVSCCCGCSNSRVNSKLFLWVSWKTHIHEFLEAFPEPTWHWRGHHISAYVSHRTVPLHSTTLPLGKGNLNESVLGKLTNSWLSWRNGLGHGVIPTSHEMYENFMKSYWKLYENHGKPKNLPCARFLWSTLFLLHILLSRAEWIRHWYNSGNSAQSPWLRDLSTA